MPELNLTYNVDKMELTIYPIDSSRLHNLVEIVRCEDCKHYDSFCGVCQFLGSEHMSLSDFCSYGERREGE